VTNQAATWLKKTLDYEFADARLLQLALTHRSSPGDNNERLEFLGDAVLDFVISEVVFRTHPLAPEGDLSREKVAGTDVTRFWRMRSRLFSAQFILTLALMRRGASSNRPMANGYKSFRMWRN
jgi:hypothetical protein